MNFLENVTFSDYGLLKINKLSLKHMNKNLAIEILKKTLTTISGKIFLQNVYPSKEF